MRSGDRAGAQLSESAGKLRGAAAARSAARVARSGQRRLHAQSGRRASFGPSPDPRAPGHGGAAAAAGVPGAPGRPSLHRGSPRAHWPRRGDHQGRSPLQAPPPTPPHTPRAPDREGAEGGGPAPHGPARRRCLAQSQRYPARPRVAERSAVLQTRSCGVGPCGRGGGRGRKGAAAPPPGESGPRWRGAEPGHRRSSPGGPGHSWPSEKPGSPLAPGYFPQPSVHGRRLNLALVWLPCKKMEKLVPKVLEFMRSRL